MPQSLGYRRTHEIEDLYPQWEALCGTVSQPAFCQRPEWYRAVQEHLQADLVFHGFFDGDQLVAVFPLCVARPKTLARAGSRHLETASHHDIYLADAVIHSDYEDRPWVDLLLAHVANDEGERPHTIRFHRIRSGSCLLAGLRSDDRRCRRRPTGGSTYCACPDPSSLQRLSGKHLRNIDRLHRRAAREVGEIEHTCLARCDAVDRGFDELLRVEAAGWKGPNGARTSLSCAPESEAFFRAVMANFAAHDDARVDVLSIGGIPAAAQLAVRSGRTWNLLKIGFDDALSRLGPGNILLKLFIEQMAADPEVENVSLVTAPDWARRWHMETEPIYEVALFAGTVRGLMHSLVVDAQRCTRVLKSAVAWPG